MILFFAQEENLMLKVWGLHKNKISFVYKADEKKQTSMIALRQEITRLTCRAIRPDVTI